MKRRPLLPLVLLAGALPVGAAIVARGELLRFQPEDGSSVDRTFDIEATFFLDDIQVNVDGQEMPPEMMMGELDGGILVHLAMEVSDEFVRSEGGRPLELVRSYESMTVEAGPEGETEEMEDTPEIVGRKIRFRWDPDQEVYVKTYADDEDGEAAEELDGLEVDFDCTALLPDDEVSEGDTWTVEGTELGSVFLPGGMIFDQPEGEDAEMAEMVKEALQEQFEEAFSDFAIECKYLGKQDGGLGEIELRFDGDASIDLTDVIMNAVEMQAGEMPIDIDATVTLDLELEGQGTLLWNLENGHLSSLSLSNDMTMMLDASADISGAPDGDHSVEASLEMSGEGKWSLTAE